MGRQQQVMGQQQQINTTHHQQNVEVSTEHESTSPRLTYRQKRRLEQAKLRLKFPDRKRFGQTMGKKCGLRMWNSNSEEKIKINFIDELRHVVGEKEDELICDCINWHISKVNIENKLKQTETPANGARSTTRIFHVLVKLDGELNGSSEPHETLQDPVYITIFEKTKKHKGSGWEPNAEKDYEALKRLHDKEIEKHGEDTLSVKDVYMKVFKEKFGYVKGLGPGAPRVSLSSKIPKLKDDAAARGASLASEIETLKASNVELKNSNEELKTSNEQLIASNDDLKATVSRINMKPLNVNRSSKTI
ncbi:hypothetical protein RDABS01_017796 [Bienertia sinuspersici]